jgi:hypothetical protein
MMNHSNVDSGSQEFTNGSPLRPLIERIQRRGRRAPAKRS